MIKIAAYLSTIIVLGGSSAWVGQKWRYEGAIEESNKATVGSILFQGFQSNAEAEAQKIFAEKERDGERDASAIEQAGRAEGRKLSFQGDAIRTHEETVSERTTREFYLDPMFGADQAIATLKQKLDGDLPNGERENILVAIEVLTESREKTRAMMADLRIQWAKRASDEYFRKRVGHCGPLRYANHGDSEKFPEKIAGSPPQ